MKTTLRLTGNVLSFLARVLALFTFSLCVAFAPKVEAAFSDTIVLDRYTLIDGFSFQHDYGYLHSTGQFQVLTTDIEYYDFYGLTPDDIAPISGQPIMDEYLFNSYQSLGLIPKWVRSQYDFTIGYETYVIVAVSGKGNPNPTVTITGQPPSQRVLLGDPAYFYVDADPILYLSYQWYFKNKPLPGKTSFDLWIGSVTPAQAGLYKVAVSSGGTPVMSKNALLQIVTPVAIKTPPKTQTVIAGKKVIFRVAATGTGPYGYQWYWNTNTIPAATNSFYVIPKAQTTNSGQYVVVVNNGLSWAVSNPAQLTVKP
jgi:hypothetical protein